VVNAEKMLLKLSVCDAKVSVTTHVRQEQWWCKSRELRCCDCPRNRLQALCGLPKNSRQARGPCASDRRRNSLVVCYINQIVVVGMSRVYDEKRESAVGSRASVGDGRVRLVDGTVVAAKDRPKQRRS
jgi:hypothetical protein